MPEGAEVKRCAQLLNDTIKGKILNKITPISGKLLKAGIKNLDSLELPITVLDVFTKGKVIFIHLENNKYIISTLGMAGWWYPKQISEDTKNRRAYVRLKEVTIQDVLESALKQNRLELETSDGVVVFYSDARNFGNMSVVSEDEAKAKQNSLGIDLMSDSVDGVAAFAALKSKKNAKKEIGEVLLDQSVLSGLGNIYRAETLYLSNVSPYRLVKDLSDLELKKIIENGSYVLQVAFYSHGSMYYDFLGGVPLTRHLVYSQKRDIWNNDVTCGESAGRTIWWVPALQS
jgi:formamidopyrimidine-DNA glycosylase